MTEVAKERWILLLIPLLLIAGALRVHYADESRFMAERQYRSALITRADYLRATGDISEAHRQVAYTSAQRMGVMEPPIMEFLAVRLYQLAGGEDLRLARSLAAVFWLAGGIFLFLLATRFTEGIGALAATAYFLFLPLGFQVSIAFLPDSLMVMLFVAALWALVRHEECPSWGRMVLATLFGGAAVLVKPVILFPLVGAFVTLRVSQAGFRGLFDYSTFIYAFLGLAPALSYYFYGIYVAGFLGGQAGASFVPELLLLNSFWKDTFLTIVYVFGVGGILLAILGLVMANGHRFNPFLLGILGGHAAVILLFTFHVRFAGHYHLALLIPVAIWIGLAVEALLGRVLESSRAHMRWPLLSLALVFLAVFVYREISHTIHRQGPIVDRDVARLVGEAVEHSDRVVYVTQYYGEPLQYYGWLSGWYWPRAGGDRDRALYGAAARQRGIEERLGTLGSTQARAEPDFMPEYFVVTDFREYRHHADLSEFLEDRCRLLSDDARYLVFGDCVLPQAR
jgi:hypothetical protein